ncbi:hypothetical protein [Enterococcus faecalis]|uniref:hypothetical protein n=1 Tax=Enterococcus TaxID=1350 RepID=UPI0025B05621|nr:hypothetical protein [Enterococcus faecalis]MDN3073031.1 hypothetical protein [Enterococcus faecalis]
MGATRSVASVPAVYQFLSLGQKSKVIFVPGSFSFLFQKNIFCMMAPHITRFLLKGLSFW